MRSDLRGLSTSRRDEQERVLRTNLVLFGDETRSLFFYLLFLLHCTQRVPVVGVSFRSEGLDMGFRCGPKVWLGDDRAPKTIEDTIGRWTSVETEGEQNTGSGGCDSDSVF